MNAAGEVSPWSVRQWVGATLIVLIVQLLLVFGLSRRGFAEPLAARRTSPVRLATVMGAKDEDRIMAAIGGIDPALFAVAHRAGFSARSSVTPSASAPVLAPLLEPPHWLQGNAVFSETALPAARIETGGRQSAFMAVDRLPSDFSGLAGGAISLPRETKIRVGGNLSKRPVIRGDTGPLLIAPQVVNSSVVQAGVDAEGFVQSVRLLNSSGWGPADQEALKLARKIRFQGGIGTNRTTLLDWGTISFPWQLSDTAATNRVF